MTDTAPGPSDTAIAAAQSRLGEPYRFGGNAATGPTDCSGLIQWAYARAGVNLPRTSQEQRRATPDASGPPLPGDLLFYDADGHVTMVVGPGLMIEDPHTGSQVRVVPIRGGWDAHTRPANVGAGIAAGVTAAAGAGGGGLAGAAGWVGKPSNMWRIFEGLIGLGALLAGLIMMSKTVRSIAGAAATKGLL
jgi:hypothetical protein